MAEDVKNVKFQATLFPAATPQNRRAARDEIAALHIDLLVGHDQRRGKIAARPTNGPQVPHLRDELYFVAAESGRYRVEDKVSDVGPGDLLFCAAHVAHGFVGISEDFSVWVLLYGGEERALGRPAVPTARRRADRRGQSPGLSAR